MAIEAEKKWEGRVKAKLRGCSVDQIWPLLEDFFDLNKWHSSLDACYGVEGKSGQPGCVWYCSTTSKTFTMSEEEKATKWALEKLLCIDPIGRCFSNEIADCNTGFDSFVATMKLLPIEESDSEDCEMDWSLVMSPVEEYSLESLVGYYDCVLSGIAETMEAEVGAVAK